MTVHGCGNGCHPFRTWLLESSIASANGPLAGSLSPKDPDMYDYALLGSAATYPASSTGMKQSRRHVRHVSPRAASSVTTQAYDEVFISRRILRCRWKTADRALGGRTSYLTERIGGDDANECTSCKNGGADKPAVDARVKALEVGVESVGS